MSIPRLRAYQGPAILSYGFRPFFLLGSIYAGAMIPMWLGVFAGDLELPTAFAPRDWHVHEMLFGYVAAILGGFLLTAIPNWTGRLPLQGTPLAVLVSTWLAGRIAVLLSGSIGWAAAGAIDAAFLVLLAGAAAREILQGESGATCRSSRSSRCLGSAISPSISRRMSRASPIIRPALRLRW